MKEIPLGLTFDDVLIVPKHSTIQSRSEVYLGSELAGHNLLHIPIVSSPMDTVTEWEMAQAMYDAGGYGFIHRYMSVQEQIIQFNKANNRCGVAVGVSTSQQELDALAYAGVECVLVDVAYGDAVHVLDRIDTLANDYNFVVVAGNVATGAGFMKLALAGADAIRVGIGGGSACSTRITTGIGVPQLSAIIDCTEVAKDMGVTLIADGGIRNAADIAKALAAGADLVMLGNLLAGANESPGALMGDSEAVAFYKAFRGMASKEAQLSRLTKVGADPLEVTVYVEGVTGMVPATGPVQNTIMNLTQGLRSAFSYVGAKNIQEFQQNAEFIRITQAGMIESKPHDMRLN